MIIVINIRRTIKPGKIFIILYLFILNLILIEIIILKLITTYNVSFLFLYYITGIIYYILSNILLYRENYFIITDNLYIRVE